MILNEKANPQLFKRKMKQLYVVDMHYYILLRYYIITQEVKNRIFQYNEHNVKYERLLNHSKKYVGDKNYHFQCSTF